MGTSKDLFTQMREVEIFTNRFLPSKTEIVRSAQKFANDLIDSGNLNIQEKYAEIRRLKEAVDVIESEFKKSLPDENFEAFGLKGTFRNGGADILMFQKKIFSSVHGLRILYIIDIGSSILQEH